MYNNIKFNNIGNNYKLRINYKVQYNIKYGNVRFHF